MAQYDRRFVRPSVHQLLEALTEASSRASSHWQGVLERIREVPEGFGQWRDGGVVSLAWWTDADRRRHFRVQGCTADDPEFARVCWPSDQEMSPLWHVYPEYVFHRARGERADWLMLCHCGRVRSATNSYWMGNRCHRCQRYTPERPSAGPLAALPFDNNKGNLLALSSDGGRIAVPSAGGGADVWDTKWRTQVCHLDTGPTAPQLLTFTPENQRLAVAGEDRSLRILHLASGREEDLLPTPKGLRQVRFAADGGLLVMVGSDSTEIWGRSTSYGQRQLVEDISLAIKDAAVSSSGEWIALAAGEALLLLKHSKQAVTPHWMVRDPTVRYRRVAFQRDGHSLMAARTSASPDPQQVDRNCQLVRWAVGSSTPAWSRQQIVWAESAVLSSSGQWLASFNRNSVSVEETSAYHGAATYRTDPRSAVTSLAFSADERTLAVTDDSGRVYLWPWARMW